MCGIFAVVNDQTNEAARTVLTGLKKLEYRGYDSWGIAIKPLDNNKLEVEKHIGKIGEAQTSLPESSIAIGHTRWATHGGVTDLNAHPHLDCLSKIAVIHNGIVENYLDIKQELLKKGHKFLSETDTEVIAHLIEEKNKTMPIENAVYESFNMLQGSNAVVVLDYEKEMIIAARDGSPLVIGYEEKNNQYFLGSDIPAFLKFTNKVYFLKDKEIAFIKKSGITLSSLRSWDRYDVKYQIIDWKVEDAEKGGFPHFLIKEINEQKITIEKTTNINEKEINEAVDLIKKSDRIILIGCGSAGYCALAGKYFFAKENLNTESYIANEFIPFTDSINDKTVIITISQSGETADTLVAVRAAKKKGAKIVSLINARGSTLERLSDIVISLSAGPEIAVVSTKAFTSQLANLYLISKAIKNKLEEGRLEMKKLKNELIKWLNYDLNKKIIELAKSLIEEEHVYVIGKYLNFPGALEFALKIKETAYIHAEAFASGELKHGVITLIQKNTPCFVLASDDEVKSEILSSASELKARGGRIIGVAPFKSSEFDELIQTPDLGDLTIFANIIVGQLLGYYLGVGRGTDPDKPRNLAKSVTVK